MKNIKIEVTQEELSLVITLLSDQLFRREFIDPKMPGYKRDPAELAMGKEVVLRLKAIVRQISESPDMSVNKRQPSRMSRSANGIPDAV